MMLGCFIGACLSSCRWRCVPGLQLLLRAAATTTIKEMLINVEREVGLVHGADTNTWSWLRSFLSRVQSEEGEMTCLSAVPEFLKNPNMLHDASRSTKAFC